MKIFAIYVIIGIIEWILICMQVNALQAKEERENGIQFKPEYTPLERWLSMAKSFFIMAVPILRTIITFVILFSEDAHDAIVEKLYESPTFSKK